ncbi:MAG: sigma-54-dependent Fis family transcriptional regulator [Planctomycetaceae bacterium]|nr:sigma-54-dependent Fis family transcriptional regulator [Planctomycetaceae bacterium]
MPSVLVIDDDRSVRHLISEAFCETDIDVVAVGSAEEGLQQISSAKPDTVMLDIMLDDASGLELFRQIQALDSKLPVIFITALDSSDTAIQAMKLGAYDYLLKPLDLGKVQSLVRQALEIRRLMHVPVGVPGSSRGEHRGEVLVGRSAQMQEVYKAIGRVAPQDVTVLIRGESGTGKELVARAIYHHSQRSDGPFLAVNCAAIPDALLESELFGHEKGSFTGADQRRIGKFEQCSGGTLFLDEVGDMSPLVQSKVLRVLQGQEFERVGGNQTIKSDVRVITATNRDLEKMVADREYRADLYYRLSSFTIQLPPLRERADDLLLLLEHYLACFSRELGKDVHGISPEALNILLDYAWPGNIRELQNVLKQALLQATGTVLISEFLPAKLRNPAGETPVLEGDEAVDGDLTPFIEARLHGNSTNLHAETLERMERYLVTRVLRTTDGNQSKAAKILGITRGSLRTKIRALGLSIDRQVKIEGDGLEEAEEEEAPAT